jgi:hypothetical protein
MTEPVSRNAGSGTCLYGQMSQRSFTGKKDRAHHSCINQFTDRAKWVKIKPIQTYA